jgi:N-acetylmuramoyl-L-alanine amidase
LYLFSSIEERAQRIPEATDRLRYLRKEARREDSGTRWYVSACIAVALACLSPAAKPVNRQVSVRAAPVPAPQSAKVFLVERTSEADRFSNGLEVRTVYQTQSRPRRYISYSADTLLPSASHTGIVGIVFHTTESLLLPLESGQRNSLNRTRSELLEHVRDNRLYNFVIDRFGQVFRVVPEDQVALHSGHSVWGDAATVLIDLNESFLGIAFEARTGEEGTAAQLHSASLLTAMVRGTYGIPDANCVTHAQVSINPENLHIGYHTDWAAHFPFPRMGLNVGYKAPVISVQRFGFVYDETFLASIGGHPWEGLVAAENQIILDAAARGITPARHRQILQQQYQAIRRLNHEKS